MTEAKKYFVCGICGNQVELFEDGGGDLICCGEPMQIIEKSCESASDEGHELQITRIPGGVRVSVGKNKMHAMTPGHLIQWLECWIGNHIFRKHFAPNDEPCAEFMIEEWLNQGEVPGFRAFCNVHGMRYCKNCEGKEPASYSESSSASCSAKNSCCGKTSAV